MSGNTYCTITSHHWVINNMCSRFGMCHYETESRREVKETERERERENMNVIKPSFLGASFLPGMMH